MSDTRSQIGDALAGFLSPEKLDTLAEKILEIEKSARGWCPNCNKAVMVTVPDAKAVTSALKDLATEAWGKPSEDRPDEERITFVRKVVYGGKE